MRTIPVSYTHLDVYKRQALYNLVDAYFVGGLGQSQMAAISVVYPLGQVVVGLGLDVYKRQVLRHCRPHFPMETAG